MGTRYKISRSKKDEKTVLVSQLNTLLGVDYGVIDLQYNISLFFILFLNFSLA